MLAHLRVTDGRHEGWMGRFHLRSQLDKLVPHSKMLSLTGDLTDEGTGRPRLLSAPKRRSLELTSFLFPPSFLFVFSPK